jgi:glutamate racemase
MSHKAIGIFDSGIGGLTVCKAIHELLPGENLIYFGDTARFPYGTRSKEMIIRYATEITDYLISRQVKMIVIACNTASATALEYLREHYDLPIVGVVEAGARAACTRRKGAAIGVIGTRATVNSGSYIKAINGIAADAEVRQQQASLFVSLTEEGMTRGEIARLAAKEYLDEMYNQGVRTLLLGCTHFPLMKDAIAGVYPDMELIDTGEEIAREVKVLLEEKGLANQLEAGSSGNVELLASDITDAMKHLKRQFFNHKEIEISKLILSGNIHD